MKNVWTMIIKQKISPMLTAGSRVTESKKQSNQVKSYTVPAQPYGGHKKNYLPPGTSGQVGLSKSPIK